MNGGFGRAALAGIALAVLALVLTGALLALGVVELPNPNEPVTEVLVVALAPDESGGESAVLALRVDLASNQAKTLDTEREAPLPGTSARNAREAYPFGGGAAVARCLSSQTGGRILPWIVLPPKVWAALLDDSGGFRVTVERGISIYLDGRLTVIERGDQTLSGGEAAALASADSYMDEAQRASFRRELSGALAKALLADQTTMVHLIESGLVSTDLGKRQLFDPR